MRYASQIIQVEPELPTTPDVWEFHEDEPKYYRELPDTKALAAYALSPSTTRVGYQLGTLQTPAEWHVYGPRDSWVLYTCPLPVSGEDVGRLIHIASQLHAQGKLVAA